MGSRFLLGVLLCACSVETATIDQASTVCGAGPTVNGMDVSYYDTAVDWPTAKTAGIDFAFIRVTDGTQYQDPKFPAYWQGARDAGVIRGAYQFFRPAEDPIAQADLMLSLIGPPQAGDLPPVIDVEVDGGLDNATVAANVKAWVDHVHTATGRVPIVYAGLYSWPDLTGGADETASPLWLAQYTTAACPDIPAPWTQWLFWQHSDTGKVAGVTSSQLDLNVFNGTLDQLKTFAAGSDAPCGVISANGGEIDDSDACFTPGGPSEFMRHATDAGNNGSLYWTHTTQATSEANYGEWNVVLDAAGSYHVEVYTAAAYAQSHAANYRVQANGAMQSVTLDQTAVDGWQALGDFQFAAGGDQWINLGDNTGEATQEQLVFDTVRLTPIEGIGSGTEPGSKESSGCSTTGNGGGALVLIAIAALRRRKR